MLALEDVLYSDNLERRIGECASSSSKCGLKEGRGYGHLG